MSDDVRALGRGAPVRVTYEVAKRSGLLGALLRVAAKFPSRRTWSPRLHLPDSAHAQARQAGNRIVDRGAQIFGRSAQVPRTSDDWLVGLDGHAWPRVWWWKISTRNQPAGADLKFVWEPARHEALVTLARAASVEPGSNAGALLNKSLSAFLDIPLERGPHWASNLEVSLRALNWQQILEIAPDVLDPDVRARLNKHLAHSVRHVVVDLPYTLSSMHNNHLVGDATCLAVLGGAMSSRAGRWLLRRAMREQVAPDGSTSDRSPDYTRFVFELLRRASTAMDTDAASERIASYLGRIGAIDGECPSIGDSDNARVIVPVDGSDRLGIVGQESSPEVAVYEMSPLPIDDMPAEGNGQDFGGIARCSAGELTAWMVAGWGISHAHADLGSVSLRSGSNWIVVDPGTGTYSGDAETRNHLRSSRSHSVLEVDGLHQVVPRRSFAWGSSPDVGFVGRGPLDLGGLEGGMWVACYHRAYDSTGVPVVVRVLVLTPLSCSVIDLVPNAGAAKKTVSRVVLHPEATMTSGRIHVAGEQLTWSSSAPADPTEGRFSPRYGLVVPTTVLEVPGTTAEPSWWSLGRETPEVTAHGRAVSVNGLAIAVRDEGERQVLSIAGADFAVP